MITIESTALVLVDVQGRLATIMHEKDSLFRGLRQLIRGCRLLEVPILWNEQLPDKLGETAPEIREELKGLKPMPKSTFSCCGNPVFVEALRALGRKRVLLAGIEAHICVYQTGADLLRDGFEVYPVVDAVSSRTAENRELGLERMREAGARFTSVEMALFEMLRTADDPRFRDLIRIIK